MATIPPPIEDLPSTSVPCPSCGVPVAIGYLRCPKCKAAVPQGPRPRRGSVREQLLSGGTSIEPETAGGGAWLPWVLAALVIVGIGAFLAFRGGGAKSASTEAPAKVTGDDEPEADEDDDQAEPDDQTPKRRVEDVAPIHAGDPMDEAERAFDADLTGERLWAKVSHDDTTLQVESSLCAQIEAQLADVTRRAYGLGARRVECHSKNGEVVFDRGL